MALTKHSPWLIDLIRSLSYQSLILLSVACILRGIFTKPEPPADLFLFCKCGRRSFDIEGRAETTQLGPVGPGNRVPQDDAITLMNKRMKSRIGIDTPCDEESNSSAEWGPNYRQGEQQPLPSPRTHTKDTKG